MLHRITKSVIFFHKRAFIRFLASSLVSVSAFSFVGCVTVEAIPEGGRIRKAKPSDAKTEFRLSPPSSRSYDVIGRIRIRDMSQSMSVDDCIPYFQREARKMGGDGVYYAGHRNLNHFGIHFDTSGKSGKPPPGVKDVLRNLEAVVYIYTDQGSVKPEAKKAEGNKERP